MIGYLGAFTMYTAASADAVILVMLVRRRHIGAGSTSV
jgi:hypothetical protein